MKLDKKYHRLLNSLTEAGHPFPEVAVKRAIKAKGKGAGLTKIPLAIIQEDYDSKKEAKQKYEDIEDSVVVEALYLTRKDTENESTIGFDLAVTYFGKTTSKRDIVDSKLPVKLTPEIPLSLTGGIDVASEFSGIFREVKNAFSSDFLRGYDHKDEDRKRLTRRLKTLIEQVS